MRIFGYGSLLSEQSVRATVPGVTDIHTGIVAGYRRVFSMKSPYRKDSNGVYSAVLTLEPAHTDVFGVSFSVPESQLSALLTRERGYHQEKVCLQYCKHLTTHAITFIARPSSPYYFVHDSDAQLEYLDICLSGAATYGEAAVQNFLHTTWIDTTTTLYAYLTENNTLYSRYSKFITTEYCENGGWNTQGKVDVRAGGWKGE